MDISENNSNEIMVMREALACYRQQLKLQMENLTINEVGLFHILKMYELRQQVCINLQKQFNDHDRTIQPVTAG